MTQPDDVTKLLLEKIEHWLYHSGFCLPEYIMKRRDLQSLLAHIRHQQERIATLEGENGNMREALEWIDECNTAPGFAQKEPSQPEATAETQAVARALLSSLSRP